jgi:hypothetical protein
MEKYPCPEELSQFKHLFYTPVNVVGFNKLLLCNDGVDKTAYKTKAFNEAKC